MGRDVVVDVNKYRIDEDDRDGVDGNRDGKEGGEDTADALSIDNDFVR